MFYTLFQSSSFHKIFLVCHNPYHSINGDMPYKHLCFTLLDTDPLRIIFGPKMYISQRSADSRSGCMEGYPV